MNQESLDVDTTQCRDCIVKEDYNNRILCKGCENFNHYQPSQTRIKEIEKYRAKIKADPDSDPLKKIDILVAMVIKGR